MGGIVLDAVLGKFVLLVFDEHAVGLLQVVDFDVESVDGALQFGNITLGDVDSLTTVIALLSSDVQLLVKTGSAVNEGIAFLLKN